ncbi:peptide-methionine (R)-S-oxide reductase MsrB [Synechocystis sp. LKSZ1]|uniref:peptide-methionine (R)-S-oxide reductase MsrB n=1 Tax=Synechocystis sp. LKSZ1 TaxID=3144951 RepID=UPI00336BEDA1
MKRRYLLGAGPLTLGALWSAQYLSSNETSEAKPSSIIESSTPMAKSTEVFEVTKTDAEWQAILTPEQYKVLRKHGTERAGTSPLDKQYGPGTYRCAGCDQPLFSSETKFNSGTGWPSFYAPLENAVATSVDRAFFMTRTEVHCDRCGGHLGHVFDDGPAPTGKRYCMNGVALKFTPKQA